MHNINGRLQGHAWARATKRVARGLDDGRKVNKHHEFAVAGEAVVLSMAVDTGNANSHTPGRSVGFQRRHNMCIQNILRLDVEQNLQGVSMLNSSQV